MSKTHLDNLDRGDAPLTPSQLVFHDNVIATEQMPDVTAQRLAQRRLYLSSSDAKADLSARLKRHADEAGLWECDLPAKSTVGLPGRTAERLDPKSVPKNILGKTHLDAFRPPWANHTFHPKVSGVPEAPQTLLRTIKGRGIRPNYGVYGSDDRVPIIRPDFRGNVSAASSPGRISPSRTGASTARASLWVRGMC
jgi:hypothetical protein